MLALFRDLGYPEISPLPEGPPRPRWSVMVPTTTAGGVAPVAAVTTPIVGFVAHVATTTNKSTIFLTLP